MHRKEPFLAGSNPPRIFINCSQKSGVGIEPTRTSTATGGAPFAFPKTETYKESSKLIIIQNRKNVNKIIVKLQ